jgi:hypothetical protein
MVWTSPTTVTTIVEAEEGAAAVETLLEEILVGAIPTPDPA